MINITTRTPAAIKQDKFEVCMDTLAQLAKCIHGTIHTHYKKLLQHHTTYYIELHAFNVEKNTGTIKITLIKSLAHLADIEVQYQVEQEQTVFFTTGGLPITQWEEVTRTLLSSVPS